MEYPHCAICLKTIESDGIVLASKGIDGVNRASKARGDTFSVVQGDSVHKECRQTIPAQITLTNMYVRVKRQNTPEEIFVRAENCRLTLKKTAYFVERRLTKNKNEKRARVVCRRMWARGDECAETVRARIQSVHDLPAAISHHSCSTSFCSTKL